jgi:hypothetical protein
VAPFGSLHGVKLYIIENVSDDDRIAFNAPSLARL